MRAFAGPAAGQFWTLMDYYIMPVNYPVSSGRMDSKKACARPCVDAWNCLARSHFFQRDSSGPACGRQKPALRMTSAPGQLLRLVRAAALIRVDFLLASALSRAATRKLL